VKNEPLNLGIGSPANLANIRFKEIDELSKMAKPPSIF